MSFLRLFSFLTVVLIEGVCCRAALAYGEIDTLIATELKEYKRPAQTQKLIEWVKNPVDDQYEKKDKPHQSEWQMDFNNDGLQDHVIWLQHKKRSGDYFFLFLQKKNNTFKWEKIAVFNPEKERFCGYLEVKQPKERGIAARDYFQEGFNEESKTYANSLSVEISYDVPFNSGDTWTDECYCTRGYYWLNGKVNSALACD